MTMTFNYAQQGTVWVISTSSSGTPADVNLTLSLSVPATDFFAPYVIRNDAIADFEDFPKSRLIVNACDSSGNSLPSSPIPLTNFELHSHELDVSVAFSNGAAANVAGFMVKLCVWTAQSGFNKFSNIEMKSSYGVSGAYKVSFAFDDVGTALSNATAILTSDTPVPWGTTFSDTVTGMS